MIYRPPLTHAMEVAKKFGCKVSHGLPMLLYQGAEAFEIWTKHKAPLKIMAQALKREVYGK
jgi:shikimate dehydrogenase